ncbi:MAG: hypothetical protein ACJ72C_09300 [Nitrososphaeraceae archaeon]
MQVHLDVLHLKHISFLLLLYFFIFLGFNIFYTSFPIHAVSGLGWTVTEMGIFFAILSGIMVLVQGPILRKALKKFSGKISSNWQSDFRYKFHFVCIK